VGSPFVWTEATFIDALRNTIGDPAGAAAERWDTATLDGYGNRAMLQVGLDTDGRAFESSWIGDVTLDQREYKLPGGFYKAIKVEYIRTPSDVRLLNYIPDYEQNLWGMTDPTATGIPTSYYLWRKLGDDPVSAQQPNSISSRCHRSTNHLASVRSAASSRYIRTPAGIGRSARMSPPSTLAA